MIIKYISYDIFTTCSSIYGLFEKGITQMMQSKPQNSKKCLSSNEKLYRLYMMGKSNSSLELVTNTTNNNI